MLIREVSRTERRFVPAPGMQDVPPAQVAQSDLPAEIMTSPISGWPSLSLVLPCFNEEPNIERTIRAAQRWFDDEGMEAEIIVTDDGSRDGSLQLLQRLQQDMPNLKVVHHKKNLGYGAAVRSGCDAAEKQWIAFMDSDGQFHAYDLRRLLPLMDDADYVTGVREKRADTFIRWLNSRLYNLFIRVVLGVKPSDLNCGMKVFRRSIWQTIRPVHATGALINAEMFYSMKHAGIVWKETPVPHHPRLAGEQTGARLRVILRTFKELWLLKRSCSRMLAAKDAPKHTDEDSAEAPLVA